jgi:hypothetical protein
MNNKYAVEKIAREELPGRVTCLIPGFFYTNLRWKQYCWRQGMSSSPYSLPLPLRPPHRQERLFLSNNIRMKLS